MHAQIIVCITVHNHQNWLDEAVKSCVDAGFQKILIYDDGSTVPLNCKNGDMIRSETRSGPYVARLALLDLLDNSDYVSDDTILVFLDGDDKLINTDKAKSLIEL